MPRTGTARDLANLEFDLRPDRPVTSIDEVKARLRRDPELMADALWVAPGSRAEIDTFCRAHNFDRYAFQQAARSIIDRLLRLHVSPLDPRPWAEIEAERRATQKTGDPREE